ncbi:uncharacterized protein LOC103946548 isoform X1 [Pyrus x bretschneideri]|uniref:uncharacterized protein LOC103946548 isoform X1 n=1 Tax=Pyrus x bretschneideri TaxID=225117 RepID=UPI00202DEA61|nr:uncharacterized protein LOC103946548 isoform X1 [Pyrus x bretschneideri]
MSNFSILEAKSPPPIALAAQFVIVHYSSKILFSLFAFSDSVHLYFQDKALDALTIEDKKRQYAAAKNYLEDLSSLLSDLGLNIREEHVFSTTDGNSLDVLWWMDGWSIEGEKRITDLKSALKVKIRKRFFLHKVEKDLAAVTD